VDDDFSFLTDDNSQPYMTISVNRIGEMLVHWKRQGEPTRMLLNDIDELKQIILRRFAAKDYPKENELFHIEISPSTPDNKVLAISDMLMEIGVRCCHLALHSPSTLPPPPTPIMQSDVLTIVEEETEAEEADDIYQVVEEQPLYPGGMDKMAEFLQANIKYPALCKKEGIQGRVVVQFVVNKDGSICDAKVVKSAHPQLDAEAIRVISSMPRWIPGKQKGKNVRVRYTLPVHFRLP
jgi:TonB family protein